MRQGSPGFPALGVLGEGHRCTGTQAPPGVWVPQGSSRARLGLLWDSSWQRRPLQACVHPGHRPPGPLETQVTRLQLTSLL